MSGPRSAGQDLAPRFSVVTVVLNDEAGLRLTMASLRGQRWRDYEWIVVDGASRDGTPSLLSSGEAAASQWISEKDRGIYDAMGKGALLARGEFVVFMNAGDQFSSDDTLNEVARRLDEAQGANILFGGATLVLPNGVRRYRGPRNLERHLWRAMPANHQATYFARALLLLCPYDASFRIAGDYALVASLSKAGAVPVYLDRSLVDFRVGDVSSKHPWLLLKEGMRVQRRILGLSRARCLVSYVRRGVSIFGLRLLSRRGLARAFAATDTEGAPAPRPHPAAGGRRID